MTEDNDPTARRKRILHLALPLIGGMISQNVLNLVDTGMVGTLGDDALAGVGLGGFLNFLLSAFIMGLGAGVQAMASRRVGEGRDTESAIPLNGGLVFALLLGIPTSALLVSTAHVFYPWTIDDPGVIAEGVPYLRARLLGMTALAMNFAFRGYWNATDQTALYMRTLIVMHVINIGLNWVLIFGNLGAPEMGAAGAGVASMISTWVGAFMYFVLGLRHARDNGFLRGVPDRATMRTIARVSAPSGAQQFLFAAGLTVFMVMVGELGKRELAATKVMIDLMLVGILPGIGFGLASATLAGQALGRRDVDDAEQWGWDVAKIATFVVGAIGVPALVVPELILGVFLHDPQTLALAVMPMRIIGLTMVFDAVGNVLMNSMIGAGDTKRAAVVSVAMQWLLYLPAVFLLGPMFKVGLVAIFCANLVYRALQSGVYVYLWRGRKWADAKV